MRTVDPERTVPYGACAVSDEAFNVDEELARWLQEAGRRKACGSLSLPASASETASSLPAMPTNPVFPGRARRPLLLAIATIAYLQYFYAGVMFKILSLQSIIFFIAANS
jgi:hypothetical protein